MEDRIIKGKYYTKLLSEKDTSQLQNLCFECEDFNRLVYGKEVSADAGEHILFDLPPNKELKDKFVFGVFNEEKMIGVLDLIKDFKEKDEWFIGLLMLNPKYRNLGIGKALNECVKEWVSDENGKKISLGVVKENSNGYKFWENLGYQLVNESKQIIGNKEQIVLLMELKL